MGFWTNDRLEPKRCGKMIPSRASAKRRCSFWYGANATPQPEAGKFPGSLLGSRARRPKARQPLGGFSCGRPLGSGVLLLCLGSLSLQAFTSLSYLARFKSGRPHHLAGTPYRFPKAHVGISAVFPRRRDLRATPFAPARVCSPGRRIVSAVCVSV